MKAPQIPTAPPLNQTPNTEKSKGDVKTSQELLQGSQNAYRQPMMKKNYTVKNGMDKKKSYYTHTAK